MRNKAIEVGLPTEGLTVQPVKCFRVYDKRKRRLGSKYVTEKEVEIVKLSILEDFGPRAFAEFFKVVEVD